MAKKRIPKGAKLMVPQKFKDWHPTQIIAVKAHGPVTATNVLPYRPRPRTNAENDDWGR